MDMQSVITALSNLNDLAKFFTIAIPALSALAGCLRLRCGRQRCYLRAVHKLTKLRLYVKLQRDAFRVLDAPSQMRHEELETRIARDLKLDLRPQSVGLFSYLNQSDKAYLKQAARQLSSSVFIGFADDLLQRLILLLDVQVDIENVRRSGRYTATPENLPRRLSELRERERDDQQQTEQHIRLMLEYLAGKLDIDIYPEPASDMLRTMLKEKYRSYLELMQQDEQALAVERQN